MASKISSLPIVPCAPFEGSAVKHSAGICRSGVSRPWDAQPHIFMARGLAAFSRMFVQFFISALLAPSMQGRRLSVSPASSLSSFVPVCQRAIFPSLPRAAYLPSALRSGNLPCALLGIEPNALAGWRVTHRAGNWLCSSSHLLLTCEIRHHVDTGRVFHAFCEPDNKCGIGRLLQ